MKNIEDGAKGSGFFFFYCKRRSGACCVVGFSYSKLRSRTSFGVCCVAAASFHAPKLVVATQQVGAREPPELATLQQQASSGACCVIVASKQAPEPEILRSLLRCNSKQAPELLKKLRRSSGAYCVAAASKLVPEPEILRSLLRCSSKQAPELPKLWSSRCNASSGAQSLLAEQQAPEVSRARSFLRMFR